MKVLWERQSATCTEVVASLDGAPAYTTVLTTLSTLEEKGYVTHDKPSRAFVYRPLVQKADAATSSLDMLLDRFFGNSPGVLALALLDDERLSKADIALLERVIQKKRKAR